MDLGSITDMKPGNTIQWFPSVLFQNQIVTGKFHENVANTDHSRIIMFETILLLLMVRRRMDLLILQMIILKDRLQGFPRIIIITIISSSSSPQLAATSRTDNFPPPVG